MNKIIKRKILKRLQNHSNKKEISLIIGPRQAGKTTVMKELQKWLQKKGKKTLWFNLDFYSDSDFFQSQEKLINKIKLEIGLKKGYVFIDEIQRKENAGLFLKGLYDSDLPYKFIVSGSGSVELKEKIHESLMGRKLLLEMNTLSFLEFINFKTNYKYEKKIPDFFKLEAEKVKNFLQEYLQFGGYPKVVLEEKQQDKYQHINEIYQSYLYRDINQWLKVEKGELFTNLFKTIAFSIGNITKYSELSRTLGISIPTLKKYLFYLEKTFIIKKVSPYFQNIRKEITKSPLFYFYDLGLRNFAVNLFGHLENEINIGFVFENFINNIIQQKIQNTNQSLNFYRTKDGAEIDFIVNKGNEIVPIEVKYKNLKTPTISKSIGNFIKRYKVKKIIIVNLNFHHKMKVNNTEIIFLPFYDFLFYDF